MHRLLALQFTRYAISGVLALWMCVLATSVWAPVARAQMATQGMELLCSGGGIPQWVPSPASEALYGEADAVLHHLIECPLCLPVLAPPPQEQVQVHQSAPLAALVVATYLAPDMGVAWLPPARGPPSVISS